MADNKDVNNAGDGKGNGGDGGNNNAAGDKEVMIPKSRFDEVNNEYQRLKKADEDRAKNEQEAEKKRLEEQGKFKELADKEKQKRLELESKYATETKRNALKMEAIKKGTVDPDAVVALANLNNVKLSEDGSVDATSVTTIIDTMVKEKAYLFGGKQQPQNIGAQGGAPANNNNNLPTYKRSQLLDRDFYLKNREDILKAQSEGRIVDDTKPAKS